MQQNFLTAYSGVYYTPSPKFRLVTILMQIDCAQELTCIIKSTKNLDNAFCVAQSCSYLKNIDWNLEVLNITKEQLV